MTTKAPRERIKTPLGVACEAIAAEVTLGELSPKLRFAMQLFGLECYRLGALDAAPVAGDKPAAGNGSLRTSTRPPRRPTMRRHKH